MFSSLFRICMGALCLMVVSDGIVSAQTAATISGTVRDESGAVLLGVSVAPRFVSWLRAPRELRGNPVRRVTRDHIRLFDPFFDQ